MPAYTESEIKTEVLNRANRIKGMDVNFITDDADAAYNEAVAECGYTAAAATVTKYELKNHWLIQRQWRWYMNELLMQYSLRFRAGELAAGEIVKNLERIVGNMDKAFEKAKAELDIFSSTNISSVKMVYPSGLLDDAIGQPYLDED